MTKIVHLDAGHGGQDSGAVGNGLREKDIVLRLVKRVGSILEHEYDGVKVKYTRTTDKFISLLGRAKMANNEGADYFVSIHVNAGGGTGYEDFIWDGCPTNGKTDKARKKVHAAVVPVLKKYGITNRGMKKANYAVLRETTMDAILVETLFIDRTSDANHLKDSNFLEDMAEAYAEGIADVLGVKRKKVTQVSKPKPSKTKNLYLVQVGAFSRKSNADALVKKLKAKGFDAYVKDGGKLYHVQVGAYSKKSNANAMVNKLKKAGFNSFIK